MQITFDTNNKQDLAILSKLMDMAAGQAQPEVASNTGTAATGLNLSPEGSGVSTGAGEAVAAAADPAPAPEKAKRTRKPKEEAAAPVEKQEETAGAQSAEAPTSDKPLTLDEVRAALQSFTADKGVPAGIELLKKYNAGRISELAEEDFAAFVADCK